MKKIILFILFILLIILSNAQTSICVSVDCKDSARLPQTALPLNGIVTASSPSTTIWRLIAGSGVIANPILPVTTVSGIAVGINVFQLTAQTPSSTASAMDTVIGFAPCPVPVPCPIVDSAGIIAAYLKAHPCPPIPPPIICPIIPPQRTVTSLTWDGINKRWVFGYSDGSVSFL